MKRILLAAVVVAFASPAFANNCPNDIKAIDAALQSASVDASKKSQAKQLRDQADAAHKSGNHAASMKAAADAKMLLGIK
jgi:protein involved in temperature-dependent protein secretion